MSNSKEILATFNRIEAVFQIRTGSDLDKSFKEMTTDLKKNVIRLLGDMLAISMTFVSYEMR